MNQPLLKRVGTALIAPALALLIAVIVSSLALLASGNSPTAALRAMVTYVDSTSSVITILNKAAPLYVVSLALAIGFKMNLFNIGADGQYRLAALVAAAAGAGMHLPRVIQILAIIGVAMVVGGAWAAIPGVLKVTRGVSEVISTIMLNFVATGISAFLLTEYFRNKRVQNVAETRQLPMSGRLPTLNGFLRMFGFHLPKGTDFNGYLPIAVLVGIGFYVLVWRTRFGYDLRMTGANPAAARAGGVRSGAMIIKTIVLSGMLAGLAAMGFLLCDFPKYNEGFPFGLAFTGIAVALLGRNSPGGIAVAAVAWSAIEQASRGLTNVQIPSEISKILLGTLLISSVVAFEVVRRRNLTASIRDASQATPSPVGVTS